MTAARLRLAEAIARAHGRRMGYGGDYLEGMIANDKHFYTQSTVLDELLALAAAVLAEERQPPEVIAHDGVEVA